MPTASPLRFQRPLILDARCEPAALVLAPGIGQLLAAAPTMQAALEEALAFAENELAVRVASFLAPGATEPDDEAARACVEAARALVSTIRNALEAAG